MSVFDGNFFGENVLTPKKKQSRKKRNGNGNGNGKGKGRLNRSSAKEAAMGFESPGVFMGLQTPRSEGIPKVNADVDNGLPIPELGEDFNTRFGSIGTGFTESVDPFKIGFSDILTGNGRTGEIIGGRAFSSNVAIQRGTGRKRGRPKGSGKKQKLQKGAFGLQAKGGPTEFSTKGAKKLKAQAIQLTRAGKLDEARATLDKIQTQTPGGFIKESARGGFETVKERFRKPRAIREEGTFGTSEVELERESSVDERNVRGLREQLGRVQDESIEETIEDETVSDLDLEDEDPGMDEDMDKADDLNFEVRDGEIQRRDDG